MPRLPVACLVAMVVATALPGCSAAINPATIEDARTAARVKSAILNDPDIGTYPIEVRVANGVARLVGRVPTTAEEARAVALARAVPGVVDVRSDLTVGGDPSSFAETARRRPEADDLLDGDLGGPADRRLLAVGASVGWNGPPGDTLDASSSLGPLVRVGGGTGLGLSVGFGWYGMDLRRAPVPAAAEIVGQVRIRPVMGGLGYTVRSERVSMQVAVVAGVAFNGADPEERLSGRQVPLGVSNSLAWRPGVSFWFETSPRTALNVSAGYVMTRPLVTLLDEGRIVRHRLTADALLVRVGLAYKVF